MGDLPGQGVHVVRPEPEGAHDTAAETIGVPALFPPPQLDVAHAGGEDVPLVRAAVGVVDDGQPQHVPIDLLPPGDVRALHGHVIETLEEAPGGKVGDPLLLPPPLLVVQPRVHDLGDLDGVAVRIDELQQAPLHVGMVHQLHDRPVLRGAEPVGREEALEVGEGMVVALDVEGPVSDRAVSLPRPLALRGQQHGGRLVLAQNQEGVAHPEDGFAVSALGGGIHPLALLVLHGGGVLKLGEAEVLAVDLPALLPQARPHLDVGDAREHGADCMAGNGPTQIHRAELTKGVSTVWWPRGSIICRPAAPWPILTRAIVPDELPPARNTLLLAILRLPPQGISRLCPAEGAGSRQDRASYTRRSKR